MVKIDIQGFRLESDEGGGWKLGRVATRTRNGAQVEVIRRPTYHARLDHALDRLRDDIAHDSDASSLDELLAIQRKTRELLTQAALGLPVGGEAS